MPFTAHSSHDSAISGYNLTPAVRSAYMHRKLPYGEDVDFIWMRLNFSQKAAFRNLFRYKKRLFMTVLGVAGCMALLLVGFGISDSVERMPDKQYRLARL